MVETVSDTLMNEDGVLPETEPADGAAESSAAEETAAAVSASAKLSDARLTRQTARDEAMELLEDILKRLSSTRELGDVLRAKGMLPTENPGEWLYFDLVPEQYEIRQGKPDYTGKVCVIGASLREEELNSVFGRG